MSDITQPLPYNPAFQVGHQVTANRNLTFLCLSTGERVLLSRGTVFTIRKFRRATGFTDENMPADIAQYSLQISITPGDRVSKLVSVEKKIYHDSIYQKLQNPDRLKCFDGMLRPGARAVIIKWENVTAERDIEIDKAYAAIPAEQINNAFYTFYWVQDAPIGDFVSTDWISHKYLKHSAHGLWGQN